MDAFVHTSIDLPTPAIRLARLCRGYDTDSIRCELFTESLGQDEIIPYKALSYVWNQYSRKEEDMIYINEKKAGVTCNLFKALKSLRQMDEDTILWIDAICINQNNNEEKGQQVSQMRLVYERAEEVIIWLGENNANIEILFECAWNLDRAVGNPRTRSRTYGVWKTLWDEKEKERLRFDAGFGFQHEDRRRSALRNLLGRPWFRRVWVIQEAASAKRAMVRCGPNTVPARTFAMLPQLMDEEVDSHVRSVLDVMPGPLRSTSPWWNTSRDLKTLLRKFGRSELSDPRDVVYALLGISSNFSDNRVLFPNYGISIEETVQDTIWALLFGEVLDRHLYNLPTWDKTQFLDSLQDLPGSIFDWAISAKEKPLLMRLLTGGIVPDGVHDATSNRGFLHHKLPLHTLVERGPLSAIKAFMPHADLDINRLSGGRDADGPLHLAAKRGREGAVDILLQHPKVDVNLRGNTSILEDMLRASNYYRHFAYWPDTPLNLAVAEGHAPVVKQLLNYQNTDVCVQVKGAGGTALHLAAAVLRRDGHPGTAEVVKLLLDHEDVDVNGKYWKGNSPLNIAAIQENTCMVKSLLQQQRIDVNHVGEKCTPLESAALAGSTSIIATLLNDDRLDHGAVLRSLKKAVWAGSTTVVKALLAGCSDQDCKILGEALVRASAFERLPMIQMMIDKGARINQHGKPWFDNSPKDYCMTPLCVAVNRGNEEAVRLLLKNGAQPDVRVRDITGEVKKTTTALALAIRQGRASIIEMLLTSSTSAHHKDLHDTTPLLDLLQQDSH